MPEVAIWLHQATCTLEKHFSAYIYIFLILFYFPFNVFGVVTCEDDEREISFLPLETLMIIEIVRVNVQHDLLIVGWHSFTHIYICIVDGKFT